MSKSTFPAHYDDLREQLRQVATFASISSLLSWDQETYMPHAGAAFRAEQQGALSELAHTRLTSPRVAELLSACESDAAVVGDGSSSEAANIREIRRSFERASKLPTELVVEWSRTASLSQEAWKAAREASDFKAFQPWLEKMMVLARRKADCLGFGPGGEPYDALLDEYEPGATAREIEGIFTPLAARLSALVQSIGKSSRRPSESPLHIEVDPSRQHELGQFVLRAMGFSFESGRLDTTTHPFCSGMAPGDTRLTTRYREQSWTDALYSTMHEGGHGLYEQGLPKIGLNGTPFGRFGEPLAESISLGIHESQSRMWENFVGRSREFWSWLTPHAQRMCGAAAMNGASSDELFGAVNIVRPSLIRVESDEATYNLHVLIRFEIERGVLAGAIKVSDIPGEWNRRYKQYLGVDVPDDRRGCLQDVHWSFGLIGYFPTYTLGNLYAAQFWETINQQVPDLKARMARGDLGVLKDWLNRNIHTHGKRYRAAELCRRLTGKSLGADPLMRHLEGKLKPLYGLA